MNKIKYFHSTVDKMKLLRYILILYLSFNLSSNLYVNDKLNDKEYYKRHSDYQLGYYIGNAIYLPVITKSVNDNLNNNNTKIFYNESDKKKHYNFKNSVKFLILGTYNEYYKFTLYSGIGYGFNVKASSTSSISNLIYYITEVNIYNILINSEVGARWLIDNIGNDNKSHDFNPFFSLGLGYNIKINNLINIPIVIKNSLILSSILSFNLEISTGIVFNL